MSFVAMRPDCGYRRDYLWLPKSRTPNLLGIKQALTFPIAGEAPVAAWGETATHLVVPRQFIPFSSWGTLDYPIHDITPREFPPVHTFPRTTLQGPRQTLGWQALVDYGDGILSLQPGQGKTVVWLHAWTTTRVPGLVIVHNQNLAYQWRDRALEHTHLSEDDIGWIQGDRWDWEKPLTIASIQTLVSRFESIPEEMRRHFGVVGYDEVHHLGGLEFNRTAPLFYGIRQGLSATHEREDGLTYLFKYHIGPVLFASGEHDVVPEAFFKKTGVSVPVNEMSQIRDKTGEVNNAKLYGWLARNTVRNDIICGLVAECLSEGRRILVLSETVDHVELLHKRFPGSGLLTGQSKEKGEERQKILYSHDLVFATMRLAQEGLDRKDLDTLLVVTPLASESRFRQILGRIQRASDGKQKAMAIIFEDEKIKRCKDMCRKLKNHLAGLQYPYYDLAT